MVLKWLCILFSHIHFKEHPIIRVHTEFWRPSFFSPQHSARDFSVCDIFAECAAWKWTDNPFISYLTADALRRSVCAEFYEYLPPKMFYHTTACWLKCPPFFFSPSQWCTVFSLKTLFLKASSVWEEVVSQWAVSVCRHRGRCWEQTTVRLFQWKIISLLLH